MELVQPQGRPLFWGHSLEGKLTRGPTPGLPLASKELKTQMPCTAGPEITLNQQSGTHGVYLQLLRTTRRSELRQ